MRIADLYDIYLQHPCIQTDTRKIQSGEMYFALKGDNFDGNAFAASALDMGAAYAVVDDASLAQHDNVIVVDNVLTTLQCLAKYHREQFDIPVLAITGSNGKTTTKELINAVLRKKFKTYCTVGNLNNHIGVPLTLLSIGQDAELVIVEMGANHQGEIASYCEYTLPTHVLINNCGKAHLEGFGGEDGVRKGKGELYDFAAAHNSVVFANSDLPYLQAMLLERKIMNTVSYGSRDASYLGTSSTANGLLQVAVLNSGSEMLIRTQLVGDYNFANVMAAIAIGRFFGVEQKDIRAAIQDYVPSNSRSQLVKKGTNVFILDAYNANPTSMRLAIKNFVTMDYHNKFLMLGGMKELGAASLKEHQEVVDLIKEFNWNGVALVGGDFEHVQHDFDFFETSTLAKDWLIAQDIGNAAVLIKGSRATAMERVLEV
jgi:UDP-N-acetylmuramoyl-tripeptide--D-alanyl-D-alanine ligase